MTLDPNSLLADMGRTFAAAAFPEGGVLVHLPSGDFFRLDTNGAIIWTAILQGGPLQAAAESVATAVGLDVLGARALIQAALECAPGREASPPSGIPRFIEDERTLSLQANGEVLLSFDKRSERLSTAPAWHRAADDVLTEALRILVPKVFARWCPVALHASAVSVNGRAVLFSGVSGAGKTTTARVVADVVGGRVLSEDVVVLSGCEDTLLMADSAEGLIQEWLSSTTDALTVRGDDGVSFGPLRRALLGAESRRPLQKIVFLDPRRRRGDEWSLRTLSRADCLALLFRQTFLASADDAAVRAHLLGCRRLAAQLPAAEALAIPDSVAALESASRAQMETIAS